MDTASTLLRTLVRTLYPHTPRNILIIDALLLHRVLHLEDFNILLGAQSKEIRSFLSPLKHQRLIHTHARREVRVTNTANSTHPATDRAVSREYYFINIKEAVDAAKYRVVKLRKRIEEAYKGDETRKKDWHCPRCKSEYDTMEVQVFHVGDEGFECEKCGFTLVQDEEKIRNQGSGKKIVKLNEQLTRLEELLAEFYKAVEDGKLRINEVTEADGRLDGGFEQAWNERLVVERAEGMGKTASERYVEVGTKREKGPEQVKAENTEVIIKTEAGRTEEERRAEEEKREKIRKQNMLPAWHSGSAIGAGSGNGVKSEDIAIKPEDTTSGEPLTDAPVDSDAQMEQYMAAMREEAERAAAAEPQKDPDASSEGEYESDDEFEDVSAMGTPMSTQDLPKPINGVKREFEEDSSEAATPASQSDSKRPKLQANGAGPTSNGIPIQVKAEDEESDEDEAEFEDV